MSFVDHRIWQTGSARLFQSQSIYRSQRQEFASTMNIFPIYLDSRDHGSTEHSQLCAFSLRHPLSAPSDVTYSLFHLGKISAEGESSFWIHLRVLL